MSVWETRPAPKGRIDRAAVWRSQIAPVVRETEEAGRLDLLVSSCLALTRTAMATDPTGRRLLAPRAGELAGALADRHPP
jgi:hypothetical protein